MPSSQNIKEMDVLGIVLDNGNTVEVELELAARRLIKCLEQEVVSYYGSYSPKVYERRTHSNLKKAISNSYIDDIQVTSDGASIAIHFSDDKWHLNLFKPHHLSDVVTLIDEGWRVKRGRHAKIAHFGYQDGAHFIQKAIDKFNANNPLNIKVEII